MAEEEDIMVEFVVDAEDPLEKWQTFLAFIEEVRNRLGGLGDRRTHDRVVLPPERPGPPIRWLNVLLRSNERELSVRLRIRVDNLYLVAFQPHGSDQWFELGVEGVDAHMIVGSTFTGFGGGYPELERATKVVVEEEKKKKEPKTVENTEYGQRPLLEAIYKLNIPYEDTEKEKKNFRNHASALIVVIVMICEAIRFNSVSTYLGKVFTATVAPKNMPKMINDWRAYSCQLQEADYNPGLLEPYRGQFITFLEIARALAIVKYFCFQPPPPPPPPRRSKSLKNDEEKYYLGRPLVEVFGVCVRNIDEENPGQLYGTVSIRGSFTSQYLYHRKRDNCESIVPGNNALLIGPVKSIWAYDLVTIDVDLMDKDVVSSDDQVSKGYFYWDGYTDAYDTVLSKDVRGEHGYVTVRYIVFRDAFAATVEVTLIDGDGEDPANVYGDLTARTTYIEKESVLFRKSSSENINVKPGDRIPLSRWVVAVPSNSSLIVKADLWDHDNVSSDDQIAKGTAEFPAHLSGSYEKHIKGTNGDIKVKVTWSNS